VAIVDLDDPAFERLLRERTRDVRLAGAGLAADDHVLVLGDPTA